MMKIRLIISWKSWIWDQYPAENTKWKFGNKAKKLRNQETQKLRNQEFKLRNQETEKLFDLQWLIFIFWGIYNTYNI